MDSRLALAEGVLPYLKDNAISTPEAALITVYYGDYIVGAEPPALAGLDAVLTFDQARAKQGLWPAIDPGALRFQALASGSARRRAHPGGLASSPAAATLC